MKTFFKLFFVSFTLLFLVNLSAHAATYERLMVYPSYSNPWTGIDVRMGNVKVTPSSSFRSVAFELHSHINYRSKIYIEVSGQTFGFGKIPTNLTYKRRGDFYIHADNSDPVSLRRLNGVLDEENRLVLRGVCQFVTDASNLEMIFDSAIKSSNGKSKEYWRSYRKRMTADIKKVGQNCLRKLGGAKVVLAKQDREARTFAAGTRTEKKSRITLKELNNTYLNGSYNCSMTERGKFQVLVRDNKAVLVNGPPSFPKISTITEETSTRWRQQYNGITRHFSVEILGTAHLHDTVFLKSQSTNGAPCELYLSASIPNGAGSQRTGKSYASLCGLSPEMIKKAQIQLKRLDLYPYQVDGIAGKGTLAGIEKAKDLTKGVSSSDYCLTEKDITAFKTLADQKTGGNSSTFQQRLAAKNLAQANLKSSCQIAGLDILASQERLKKLGYYYGDADGLYGENTRKSYIKFEQFLGKEIALEDGCLDKEEARWLTIIANAKRKGINCFRPSVDYPSFLSVSRFLKENSLFKGQFPTTQSELRTFTRGIIRLELEAEKLLGGEVKKNCQLDDSEKSLIAIKGVVNKNYCSEDNLENCSPQQICQTATITNDSVIRWNLSQLNFVNRAKELNLDCKLTVAKSALNQQEAIYFLNTLVEFVSQNAGEFDLNFATQFNTVRPVIEGTWDSGISETFENFRAYVATFPAFQEFMDQKQEKAVKAAQESIDSLREAIKVDLELLKEWATKNVLDKKAAQIAKLVASYNDKSEQNIASLEEIAMQVREFLSATGLRMNPEYKKLLVNDTECRSDNLENCTPQQICEAATISNVTETRWNTSKLNFVNRAKELDLDCKIKIDKTPFDQQAANDFLKTLVEFVSQNAGEFDLNFATQFNGVKPILEGAWNSQISQDFEIFRLYVANFPLFQMYFDEKKQARQKSLQARKDQLGDAIKQDFIALEEWAKKNVLDQKAAQIAELLAIAGEVEEQDIASLEKIALQVRDLLVATGLRAKTDNQTTKEAIDGLFSPNNYYIFANMSGKASSIYKNLDGEFTFENAESKNCWSQNTSDFEGWYITGQLFERFETLENLFSKCSPSTDIIIAKGTELTKDLAFETFPLTELEQILEISSLDFDNKKKELSNFARGLEKEVMDGVRVGYGVVQSKNQSKEICAVIDEPIEGHEINFIKRASDQITFVHGLNFSESFHSITENAEAAFRELQRGNCGAIYGESLTLGRLSLAAKNANIELFFLPIWMSPSEIEEEQENYENQVKEEVIAENEEEQNLKDQERLKLEAEQSRLEIAAVKQQELREQNRLKFMTLKDELQRQVFEALDFGLENPKDEANFIAKYLKQTFVDQTTRYSPYDELIADMQQLALEKWEITERRISQIDYGIAQFNGRNVSAIQVELNIASKNRFVGKYSEYCKSIHVIKDEDFTMWRNFLIDDCAASVSSDRWKKENSFMSYWIVDP